MIVLDMIIVAISSNQRGINPLEFQRKNEGRISSDNRLTQKIRQDLLVDKFLEYFERY